MLLLHGQQVKPSKRDKGGATVGGCWHFWRPRHPCRQTETSVASQIKCALISRTMALRRTTARVPCIILTFAKLFVAVIGFYDMQAYRQII